MAVAYKVAGNRVRPGQAQARLDQSPWPDSNPWEPYRLKLFPKRINGVWYAPGSIVYRRFVLSPGGGFYEYGDDFDYLRWTP